MRINYAKAHSVRLSYPLSRLPLPSKEELDEEELVKDVKTVIEEGNCTLQEFNSVIRGLDPNRSVAATAKGRAAAGQSTIRVFEQRFAPVLCHQVPNTIFLP